MLCVVDDGVVVMGTASILSLLQEAKQVIAPAIKTVCLNSLFRLKVILKN
jgi:hypothetical protein